MNIITWNCNMAFRKKYESILPFKPDVLVVQECENEDKLGTFLPKIGCTDFIWHGRNPNKGVGIFTFNEFKIELFDDFKREFEFIVPLKLSKGDISINLFAIWAMPHKTDRKKNYVIQIWDAINNYEKHLDHPSILIGDFNSNAIWDKQYRIGNHSDVVNFLNEKEIFSLYHLKNDAAHGKEPDPTIYLLKQKSKPYHLDYCFASKDLITSGTNISVGKHDHWIKLSDHMPLVVENLS